MFLFQQDMSFVIFKEIKPNEFDSCENLKIDKTKKAVYVLVDFTIFDKDVLISAAYSIQRFADVVIDSDGKDFAIVQLKKTNFDGTLEELGREFNNRLINYAHYFATLEYTKEVKEEVMEEVYSQLSDNDEISNEIKAQSSQDIDAQELHSSGASEGSDDLDSDNIQKIDEALDEELEDIDADEITVPWEEKFMNDLKDKNDKFLDKEKDEEPEK